MANWDDDDFEFAAPSVPVVASKGKWEGEDEDDSDVPDEWDAESEDDKPKVAAAPAPAKPKRSVKQAIAEREEREKQEAAERAARGEVDLSEVEDPRAKRERERNAEFEADVVAATELLSAAKPRTAAPNGSPENDLSTFRPRTKDEFDEFAKRLTEVITSVSHLPHYAMFVVGLVKAISEPMGSDDVKKASSGLTTLMNEKLKAERGMGGKKKAGKKPALVVGAAKSVAPKFDTSNYEDAGDDFDDFM